MAKFSSCIGLLKEEALDRRWKCIQLKPLEVNGKDFGVDEISTPLSLNLV